MGPRLYWIDSSGTGKIAISARPRGGDWLEDEIEGWHREGVEVVVSLLTSEEMQELGLERESDEAQRHGIKFMNLPIPDRGVPPAGSEAASFVEKVRKELESGRKVAIHCRQSIGRSGMIAAALLVKQGISPSEAIERVSRTRGLPVPETDQQRAWVFDFSPVTTLPTKSPSRR
jgi:protein-tyrosine phosphatase